MRFVLFHVEIPIFLILELEHKSMREAVLNASRISRSKISSCTASYLAKSILKYWKVDQ